MSGFKDRIYPALPVFAQNLACTLGRLAARAPALHAPLPPHARGLGGERRGTARERCTRSSASVSFRLVEHARRHVPYYRDLPPPCDAGDPREAIARTLAAWPPLEKATYRDRCEEFIARDLPRERLIRGKTSGTTGTALPLWYTRRGAGGGVRELLAPAPQLSACGSPTRTSPSPGSSSCPSTPRARPSGASTTGRGQTLFSLYHMTPENLRAYVDGIHAAPRSLRAGLSVVDPPGGARAARRRAPARAGAPRRGVHVVGVAARVPARDDRAGLRRAGARPLWRERVLRLDDRVPRAAAARRHGVRHRRGRGRGGERGLGARPAARHGARRTTPRRSCAIGSATSARARRRPALAGAPATSSSTSTAASRTT